MTLLATVVHGLDKGLWAPRGVPHLDTTWYKTIMIQLQIGLYTAWLDLTRNVNKDFMNKIQSFYAAPKIIGAP